MAVGASLIFMPLVYLSLGSNSSVVFGWFVNITTIAGLVGWLVIQITYLRFFYALRVQGISRDRMYTSNMSFPKNSNILTSLGLAYKSPFQPYLAWITACALVLVILFSGFSVFFPGHWSVSTFLTYYVDIAIFAFLWVVAFFFSRSGIVALQDVDLSEIQDVDREKTDILNSIESNLPWWRKWVV